MNDVDENIPAMFHVRHPTLQLTEIFNGLGFEIELLEHKKDVFDYEDRKNFESKI